MVTKTNDDSKWNIKRWAKHNFLIRLPRTFLHLSAQKETRGVSIEITFKPPDMEYENDYNSKYTTLYIRTTLNWKKYEQKVKNDTDVNPPGGMVNMPERTYSKRFLFY